MNEMLPEQPDKPERNLYGSSLLRDYANILDPFMVDLHIDYNELVTNNKLVRTEHYQFPTFEEKYIKGGNASIFPMIGAEIRKNTQLVRRLDDMIKILNETEDATRFKRAFNEIIRLLFDKEVALRFPESEFNPDLL